jgi:hypothetical protein
VLSRILFASSFLAILSAKVIFPKEPWKNCDFQIKSCVLRFKYRVNFCAAFLLKNLKVSQAPSSQLTRGLYEVLIDERSETFDHSFKQKICPYD